MKISTASQGSKFCGAKNIEFFMRYLNNSGLNLGNKINSCLCFKFNKCLKEIREIFYNFDILK
jgi:hypothetical protein